MFYRCRNGEAELLQSKNVIMNVSTETIARIASSARQPQWSRTPCRSTTRQPYGIDIAFASLIRPGQAPTFAASSFLIGNHHRLCQTSTAVAVSMEPNENRTDPDLPPVAALFVVYFDKRKGYTLGWHQTIAKVKLEDSVEYKSLPSGLHSLKEDVIYFIHEEYAGVSAFVTYPAEESRRNAVMLAVGALVPLSMGRLGRSWQHVPHLQALASKIAEERPDLESGEMPLPDLGKYWFINQTRDDDVLPRQGSPPPSPLSIRSLDGQSSAVGPRTRDRRTRDRQIRSSSGSTASDPQSHRLPESHPALSLPDLYDVLGPLLFPLYRAALLRKRILFVCEAPIRRACHFVYDIALLADIPASAAGVIPSRGPPSRSSLLYSIGIHDIPFLEEVARTTAASVPVRYPTDASAWRSSAGWIACTTDRLIAGRPKLFDVLVHLPSQSSGGAGGKRWARIESSDGHKIRATQRDLRRHLLLQRSLRKMHDAWHLSESPLELDVDPYDLQGTLSEDRPFRGGHYDLLTEDDSRRRRPGAALLASLDLHIFHVVGIGRRRARRSRRPDRGRRAATRGICQFCLAILVRQRRSRGRRRRSRGGQPMRIPAGDGSDRLLPPPHDEHADRCSQHDRQRKRRRRPKYGRRIRRKQVVAHA